MSGLVNHTLIQYGQLHSEPVIMAKATLTRTYCTLFVVYYVHSYTVFFSSYYCYCFCYRYCCCCCCCLSVFLRFSQMIAHEFAITWDWLHTSIVQCGCRFITFEQRVYVTRTCIIVFVVPVGNCSFVSNSSSSSSRVVIVVVEVDICALHRMDVAQC